MSAESQRPPAVPSRMPPPPPPRAAGAPAARRSAPPPPTTPAKSTLSLEQICREAFDKGFSDVHLGVGEVPRFRDRGQIATTDYPVIDEPTFYGWLAEVLRPEEIQQFKQTLDFDGAG